MTSPTNQQIASDRNMWEQYVDPDGNEPESFDNTTEAERVKILQDLWPEGEQPNRK